MGERNRSGLMGDFIYTEDGFVDVDPAAPHHHYYHSFTLCRNAASKFSQNCKTDENDNIISFTASVDIPQAKLRIGAPSEIIDNF